MKYIFSYHVSIMKTKLVYVQYSICGKNYNVTAKKFDILPAEKVYLSFARFILGVHKRTTNLAVRGELGLVPLGVDIHKRANKYKDRLITQDSD